jgi:hypothetical protein
LVRPAVGARRNCGWEGTRALSLGQLGQFAVPVGFRDGIDLKQCEDSDHDVGVDLYRFASFIAVMGGYPMSLCQLPQVLGQ